MNTKKKKKKDEESSVIYGKHDIELLIHTLGGKLTQNVLRDTNLILAPSLSSVKVRLNYVGFNILSCQMFCVRVVHHSSRTFHLSF